jgi:hypothetical protein
MSRQDWDGLSHVEECFFVNAMEMDKAPPEPVTVRKQCAGRRQA